MPAASMEDQIYAQAQELVAANPGMTMDQAIEQIMGQMPDESFRTPKPPSTPEELNGGLAGAPAGDIPVDPGLMGKNEHVTVGPNGNPLLSDGKEGYGHFVDNSLDAGLDRALEKKYADEAATDQKMADRMAVEKDVYNRQRDESERLGMIEPRTYDNLVEQDPTVTGGFRQEEVQIPSPTPDDPNRTIPVTRVTGGEQQFHSQAAREAATSAANGYNYVQVDPMTGQPVRDENGNLMPMTSEAQKRGVQGVPAYDFVPVADREGNMTYINPTLMANRPETDGSMGEMSPSQLRSLQTQQNRIRDRMGVSDEDATFTPYRRSDGSIGNRIDPNSKAVRGKRQAAVDEKQKRQNLVTMRAMMSPRDRGGNFMIPQSQINAQALLMGADMPAAMPNLSDMDEETRRGLLYQTFPNLARVDTAAGEQAAKMFLERLGAMSNSILVNPLERQLADDARKRQEAENNPLAAGEADVASGDLNTTAAITFRQNNYKRFNRGYEVGLNPEEEQQYREYYIGLGVPPDKVEQMLEEDERNYSFAYSGTVTSTPGSQGTSGTGTGTPPPMSSSPPPSSWPGGLPPGMPVTF